MGEHLKNSKFYTGLLLAAALSGCTADQAPLEYQSSTTGTTQSSSVIAGVADRGPMLSGTVTAVAVDSDGSNGTTLGTSTVASDGTFSVTLGSTTTSPIRVTVSGGSYVSELDSSTQSTSTSLTALIDSSTSVPPVLAVTPLSTFVDSYTTGQARGGTAITTAHATANSAIMTSYGFPAGTTAETTVPSFTSAASGSPALALAVLGGLEGESSSLSLTDRGSLVAALAQDVSDGVFDGKANGVAVPLGTGSLPTDAGSTLFLTGLTAFTSAQSSNFPGLASAAQTIQQTLPASTVVTGSGGGSGGGTSNAEALAAAVNQGLTDLQQNTYAGYLAAVTDFTQANSLAGTQVGSEADTARYFYAATQIGSIGNLQPSSGLTTAGGFINALGGTASNLTAVPVVSVPGTFPSTSPTGDQVRAFFQGTLANTLISSINALDAVQTTFTYSHANPKNASQTVITDYSDVLALRSSLEARLALFLEVSEYDLGGSSAIFLNGSNRTDQAFLSDNANALNQVDTSELASIQTNIGDALTDASSAITGIQARTTPPSGSVYLTSINSSPTSVTTLLNNLATYKSYLTSAGQTRAGDGSTAQLNLPFYFTSGLSIRPFLPTFNGDQVTSLYQGTPFGSVYSGYAANTEADPNNDPNNVGTPASLIPVPIPVNQSTPVGSIELLFPSVPANTAYVYYTVEDSSYDAYGYGNFNYASGTSVPPQVLPNLTLPSATAPDTVQIYVTAYDVNYNVLSQVQTQVNVSDGQTAVQTISFP